MKFLDNDKLLEVLNFRHACNSNGFDASKKISEADFKSILEAGRLSPSSFGFEPWNFLVLQDKELRQKFKAVCWGAKDALDNASHYIIILARKRADMLANSDYVKYIMQDIQKLPPEIQSVKSGFYTDFQTKHFAFADDERASFDWACKQCYISLGFMLESAALLGIDSLAIEGFEKKGVDELLSKEGLMDEKHFGVAVMLALGYRASEPKRAKTRQSLDKIVRFV